VKSEFKRIIEEIKSKSSAELPQVKFSSEVRGKLLDNKDKIDYFEAMMIMMEVHPFFPLNREFSFGSDVLDLRRALTYEVILRQLGHSRSLVANTNFFNHIGTAVALRCMLELYAYLVFLHETKSKEDQKFLDKLLHGSIFSSGEWYDYEKVWEERHGEPLPDNFKDFMKGLLKTPHVSKYLKHVKISDQGFDYMYTIYSNYVHPTFGRPREQFLEDVGSESHHSALEANDYYLKAQSQPSPSKAIKRDIKAAGFCLELFWPKVMELDPFFNDEHRNNIINTLSSRGVLGKDRLKNLI
jgi:hypothetical protein